MQSYRTRITLSDGEWTLELRAYLTHGDYIDMASLVVLCDRLRAQKTAFLQIFVSTVTRSEKKEFRVPQRSTNGIRRYGGGGSLKQSVLGTPREWSRFRTHHLSIQRVKPVPLSRRCIHLPSAPVEISLLVYP